MGGGAFGGRDIEQEEKPPKFVTTVVKLRMTLIKNGFLTPATEKK
jgi:hypothetical protein